MKVKTSSWHYRLWRFGRESQTSRPKDLCRYFWHLFLFKILLPATLLAFVLYGIGGLIWVIWNNAVTTALIIAAVMLAAAFAMALYLLVKKLYERHQVRVHERELLPPEPPKEPGVLRQYLLARKRKVCPLIKVVEDQEA